MTTLEKILVVVFFSLFLVWFTVQTSFAYNEYNVTATQILSTSPFTATVCQNYIPAITHNIGRTSIDLYSPDFDPVAYWEANNPSNSTNFYYGSEMWVYNNFDCQQYDGNTNNIIQSYPLGFIKPVSLGNDKYRMFIPALSDYNASEPQLQFGNEYSYRLLWGPHFTSNTRILYDQNLSQDVQNSGMSIDGIQFDNDLSMTLNRSLQQAPVDELTITVNSSQPLYTFNQYPVVVNYNINTFSPTHICYLENNALKKQQLILSPNGSKTFFTSLVSSPSQLNIEVLVKNAPCQQPALDSYSSTQVLDILQSLPNNSYFKTNKSVYLIGEQVNFDYSIDELFLDYDVDYIEYSDTEGNADILTQSSGQFSYTYNDDVLTVTSKLKVFYNTTSFITLTKTFGFSNNPATWELDGEYFVFNENIKNECNGFPLPTETGIFAFCDRLVLQTQYEYLNKAIFAIYYPFFYISAFVYSQFERHPYVIALTTIINPPDGIYTTSLFGEANVSGSQADNQLVSSLYSANIQRAEHNDFNKTMFLCLSILGVAYLITRI